MNVKSTNRTKEPGVTYHWFGVSLQEPSNICQKPMWGYTKTSGSCHSLSVTSPNFFLQCTNCLGLLSLSIPRRRGMLLVFSWIRPPPPPSTIDLAATLPPIGGFFSCLTCLTSGPGKFFWPWKWSWPIEQKNFSGVTLQKQNNYQKPRRSYTKTSSHWV